MASPPAGAPPSSMERRVPAPPSAPQPYVWRTMRAGCKPLFRDVPFYMPASAQKRKFLDACDVVEAAAEAARNEEPALVVHERACVHRGCKRLSGSAHRGGRASCGGCSRCAVGVACRWGAAGGCKQRPAACVLCSGILHVLPSVRAAPTCHLSSSRQTSGTCAKRACLRTCCLHACVHAVCRYCTITTLMDTITRASLTGGSAAQKSAGACTTSRTTPSLGNVQWVHPGNYARRLALTIAGAPAPKPRKRLRVARSDEGAIVQVLNGPVLAPAAAVVHASLC